MRMRDGALCSPLERLRTLLLFAVHRTREAGKTPHMLFQILHNQPAAARHPVLADAAVGLGWLLMNRSLNCLEGGPLRIMHIVRHGNVAVYHLLASCPVKGRDRACHAELRALGRGPV